MRSKKQKLNILTKRLIQLVLAVFFIVFVFTGLSPWSLFQNIIKAINDSTETIFLYANFVKVEKQAEDFSLGWWNSDALKNYPELGPEAELYEFSDLNSSFYAGGDFSLIAGKFRQLINEKVESEKLKVKNQEEKIESGKVDYTEINDSVDDLATYNLKFENQDFSSSTEEIEMASSSDENYELINNYENKIANDFEIASTTDEDFEEEIEIIEVEVPSSSTEEVVVEEIVEEDLEDDEFEVILEDDLEKELEEISFVDRIKNIFKVVKAKAQEFLSQKITNLSDLGDFKKAKLKFSIGLGCKSEIAELRELHPVDYTGSQNVVMQEKIEELINNEQLIINNYEEEVDMASSSDVEIGSSTDGELIANDFASSTEDVQQAITTDESKEEGSSTSSEQQAESEKLENVEVASSSENVASSSVSVLDSFIKAAKAQSSGAKIIIWYKTDEVFDLEATSSDYSVWHKLDTISGDMLSNALNGGYLSYDMDLSDWEEVENLQIRLEGVVNDHESFLVYLDSMWLEVEYESDTELEKLKKRQRWEEALDFLTENLVFDFEKGGELHYKYNKNEERIWDTLEELMGVGNFWSEVEINVVLLDMKSEVVDVPLTMMLDEDGGFTVTLPSDMRTLDPGKYSLKFYIVDSSGEEEEVFEYFQDFSWGVLAFNANKSEYRSDEEAYLQFGVVDDFGHTVCDAELNVVITDPQGKTILLTTSDASIVKNSECGADNVINTPDYYGYYQMEKTGEYEVKISAIIKNEEKVQFEKLYVRDDKKLEIERIGPTRIFPKADYRMRMLVTVNEDFRGNLREFVPSGFKIQNQELILRQGLGQEFMNNEERDPFGSDYTFIEKDNTFEKELVWKDVDLLKGDELEIVYSFDAPDNSPELYLLGPMLIENDIFDYKEKRAWQIASDAVNKRARTVKFMAGVYNGDATTGNQTNTDYTFSAFNFSLAETGVEIKNAFVLFETQFEAYNSTGGNYTGYKLGFDTCSGSSCATAFGTGNGQVLDDNSNILAYDETESNQIRLLFDVTNETQLSVYSGGGAQMEAQVGYHLKNGTTKDAIGNAKAVLYLTYLYDKDSGNITNTVSYPLDSTNGTDSGSRQAVQASCARDSTCPKFSYNMEIPEWAGIATSTYRLSQWFRLYGANDSNNTNDINPDINIESGGVTTNPNSNSFHHESVNGGTQGNLPHMYFDEWSGSGYAENTSQAAEVYFDQGSNYAVGGEVFETYVASSSASVKTRTVAFPVGIINNGNTISETSISVDVLFPENGDTTGVVDVKSAWFRLIPHHYNNGANTVVVTTKVGANATSSSLTYDYNGGGTVIKPGYTIVHIIPSGDYVELEKANATTSKAIKINTTYSNVEFGGISGELLITYTYSDDSNGYLTNLELFGGQTAAAPGTSVTVSTANSVFPESAGKTVLGASLFASYLNSDTGNDVAAGTVFFYDTDLSTGTPSCSNAFEVEPDDFNNYAEFYNDVTSAMDATDNQSYSACYSVDDSSVTTDGAKMGGVLSYVYAWSNNAPTSTLLTLQQKADDSGTVDISFMVDDSEGDDLRLKFEYATGTACDFSSVGDPSLDETDSSITATYQDPNIENDNEYQIGTSDAYVTTASGTNTVHFDWLAENDLGAQEGEYCLRLTANDQSLDQEEFSTSTVYVDTVNPTVPGALSFYSRTGTELVLNLNATSTETNFKEYIVYYKIFDGTDADEGDSFVASNTDSNLGDILFNDAATTSISGLSASTTYSIVLYAYDDYGNKASSSRVDITTNDPPTGVFNEADIKQKNDGSGIVDISIEVDDLNNHDTLKAKIEYSSSTNCSFISVGDPTLDENSNNVLADFGLPSVENDNEYQVGGNGVYIITSPGSNTVDFDWLGRINEKTADGEYCLRLTVNDRFDDQVVLATTSLTLDNVLPTVPGNLQAGKVTTDSITLWYASTTPSSDTNEPNTDAYKIFYKQAISDVTMNDIEINNSDLNVYDYNSATSVTISGLDENTWYVFNIWSFDSFGNFATATEIAVKTNTTVSNDSLIFMNPESKEVDTNIAIAGSNEWTFRATVSETNGYPVIASTTLYFANDEDEIAPFSDLAFSWDQSFDTFSEVGSDVLNMASISPNSSSTCALNTCTLDFKIIFNKTFASSSHDYDVELVTANDIFVADFDSFSNFYQVRFPYVEQKHYRFRRDDGGE